MNKKNTTIFILGVLAAVSLLTVFVLADADYPYGVRSIAQVSTSRANLSAYLPANLSNVSAGNVTEINLTVIATTKAWAGYYGNISGVLTLEDTYGYVFYNWTALEPKGEIYASINSTITWSNISCFNTTTGAGSEVERWEEYYGMQDDDEDGINETFAAGTSMAFSVGEKDFASGDCPSTNTYVFGTQGTTNDFENIILSDGSALVFTTIIENNVSDTNADIVGFDNRPHDFQLLVAEDGHDGAAQVATSTYYFWAEIE